MEDVKGIIPVDDGVASKIAYISFPFFDEIVYKLGYEDPKAIRKWLKHKGYTLCEKDRDYYRQTINNVRAKYVAVYLPGERAGEKSKEKSPETGVRRLYKKQAEGFSLLDDIS